MAIGKDVYCDSRLILAKLEELYPDNRIGPKTPSDAGICKLLESWSGDGGVIINVTKVYPFWDLEEFKDKDFLEDRRKLLGVDLTFEYM